MKYQIILILTAFLFVSANAQNKFLKPENIKTKTTIIISGNEREYYPLDPQKENILSIRGPGKLKIITRARISNEQQKNSGYTISYKINGGVKQDKRIKEIKKSDKAGYKNKKYGNPSDENIFILNLAEGEQFIQIWSGGKNIKVDARYVFIPTKVKKVKWVALTPMRPNEPVNLIYDEDISYYFRFSEPKPLRVKIAGPTKLRILTRVENHYTMKGKIFYRLKVNEDGVIKNTYQLSSTRSEVSAYQKDPKKVPGKAKEIVIDVPAGSHIYEIIPLDKDKGTLLGKVLFPKKDMKLEN